MAGDDVAALDRGQAALPVRRVGRRGEVRGVPDDREPLELHGTLEGGAIWDRYQRGMRAVAGISADEVAARMPVSAGATDMLDIGGSHGYFSVCVCRRRAGLRSTILDLPEAIEHAAPILAREGMGERVRHRAGNALTDDLGSETWDVVSLLPARPPLHRRAEPRAHEADRPHSPDGGACCST
ncbi:MAG: hypothetical protein IPK07_35550 [Deltaproteobacteria bacterium]|nr:hypothetical protein [Deltaproteobacteria bacterium]